jgi:SagB-type dehydrogenase family enzyme
MMDISELAATLHIATRNPSLYKRHRAGYDIHFDPEVQRLVSQGPLRISSGVRVPLPAPARIEMSLGESITTRVSGRAYGDEPITLTTLATLLYHINGVRRVDRFDGWQNYRRNVPNSGNLGSVELFPIILNVEALEPGVYHFDSVAHELVELHLGDYAQWLRDDVLYQVEFSSAAVVLVFTCAFGRLSAKYGPRSYRLGYLDAGHASGQGYLAATALGLHVCASDGFIDEALDALLGIDGLDTASVLVQMIGIKR